MNNIPTWNISEDILAVWGRNWYYSFHCDLTTTMPFPFDIDTGGHILNIYIAGCVLSYISVVFNIVLFLVLFRKQLLSPSTILMLKFIH
jgi:hypothetical protein